MGRVTDKNYYRRRQKMQLKFKCMAAEDKGVEVSAQYIHKVYMCCHSTNGCSLVMPRSFCHWVRRKSGANTDTCSNNPVCGGDKKHDSIQLYSCMRVLALSVLDAYRLARSMKQQQFYTCLITHVVINTWACN